MGADILQRDVHLFLHRGALLKKRLKVVWEGKGQGFHTLLAIIPS